jgi:hypothetical protein
MYNIKNYVWELLCIKLLANKKGAALEEQLTHVLSEVADNAEAISIEDPANPHGNDLMPFLKSVWPQLNWAATQTMKTVENQGWKGVFGEVAEAEKVQRVARLTTAAQAASQPTRPWRR